MEVLKQPSANLSNMGFSARESVRNRHIYVGACYCIGGEGDITALSNGVTHELHPFTVYALDQNDRHIVRAVNGDMRLIRVFNPALSGQEVQREDGSYAPAEQHY